MDDSEHESENTSKGSETVEVSLRWIRRQIGRVLEIFVILQFITGAFIFFGGIFLLLWAVVPSTSLKAGSYMLLAFYVIGRALLGLVGYYTDNFCLLFSYGVLLVATFVVRTILTLVRLKITSGVDKDMYIPPLLQACPGALSVSIELICSLLECSQAFCSFYLCWIIVKTATIEKNFEESRLNVATEIAKYLSNQEASKRKETTTEEVIKQTNENKSHEVMTKEINEDRQCATESEEKRRPSVPSVTGKGKNPQLPLKSILHHPSQSRANVHPEHEDDYDQMDYFKQYRKYPQKVAQPARPTQLSYQNQSFKEYQQGDGKEGDNSKEVSEVEEDLDQLVHDFNNNNRHEPSSAHLGEGPPQYGYYRQGTAQWQVQPNNFAIVPHYPQVQSPDYLSPSMMHTTMGQMDQMALNRVRQMGRAMSPTPPSELNLSSPSSPLLYEQQRGSMYQQYPQYGYGSTNGPVTSSQYHQQHMYR